MGLSQARSRARVVVKATGSNSFSLGSKPSKFEKRLAICVVGKSEISAQPCKNPFKFWTRKWWSRGFLIQMTTIVFIYSFLSKNINFDPLTLKEEITWDLTQKIMIMMIFISQNIGFLVNKVS